MTIAQYVKTESATVLPLTEESAHPCAILAADFGSANARSIPRRSPVNRPRPEPSPELSPDESLVTALQNPHQLRRQASPLRSNHRLRTDLKTLAEGLPLMANLAWAPRAIDHISPFEHERAGTSPAISMTGFDKRDNIARSGDSGLLQGTE
ncbi:hypothetical protein KC361_g285 [Hortaea werneckii]|nr:hypothetical protein KC361_g285 [Hortaea werneckii]